MLWPTYKSDGRIKREELRVSDSRLAHTVEIPSVGQCIHTYRLPHPVPHRAAASAVTGIVWGSRPPLGARGRADFGYG